MDSFQLHLSERAALSPALNVWNISGYSPPGVAGLILVWFQHKPKPVPVVLSCRSLHSPSACPYSPTLEMKVILAGLLYEYQGARVRDIAMQEPGEWALGCCNRKCDPVEPTTKEDGGRGSTRGAGFGWELGFLQGLRGISSAWGESVVWFGQTSTPLPFFVYSYIQYCASVGGYEGVRTLSGKVL